MRVGLVVPRFKQSAVARNQLKRRLRELTRVRFLPSDLPADVVVRIRPEAYRATFDLLTVDMVRALGQLTRWRDTVTEPDGLPPDQGPRTTRDESSASSPVSPPPAP
jgi:ribonuclease P protein component